jgi:hypothetical protein
MDIQFPSFEPGTPETFLDSVVAKRAKTFMEAFNNISIVIGGENKVLISDNNVVISLNRADLGAALSQAEFDDMLAASSVFTDLEARVAALEFTVGSYGTTSLDTCTGSVTVLIP